MKPKGLNKIAKIGVGANLKCFITTVFFYICLLKHEHPSSIME